MIFVAWNSLLPFNCWWTFVAEKEVPKTMPFDNSQGLAYGADQSSYGVVDSSQHYYQVLPYLFEGRICCLAAFDTFFVVYLVWLVLFLFWLRKQLRHKCSLVFLEVHMVTIINSLLVLHMVVEVMFLLPHISLPRSLICSFHPRHLKFPRYIMFTSFISHNFVSLWMTIKYYK